MKKINKIIRESIFHSTFGKQPINEETIKSKIDETLINVCGISPDEISQYYPRISNRGTLYFKKTATKENPYIPVKNPDGKKPNRKNYNSKVGIPTILNTYLDETKENFKSTLELIIFLFQVKLEPDELEVVKGHIEDNNIEDKFDEYLKEIENGSEHREDVLALMIDFLTNPSVHSLTIITNDVHFSSSIVPAMIQFIHSKKQLWLLFDPASVSDVISSRLYTLWMLGVRIGVLPIKNRYPKFGVIPNWTINTKDSNIPDIEKILQFKTFFFQKQTGRNYSRIIKHSSVIKPFIEEIKRYNKGVKISNEWIGLKELNHQESNFKEVPISQYIEFLQESFNQYQKTFIHENVVYNKVEFSFEKIEIDSIFRREKTVPLYKILQAHRFIQHFKNILFEFKGDMVIFKPYALENQDNFFPINIPFVEWNHKEKRYELCEGHSRLWILYNVYNIKTIQAIVVKKIRTEFLEPSSNLLGAKAKLIGDKEMGYSKKWDESDFKYERNDFGAEEHILEPRYAEAITHRVSLDKYRKLYTGLVEASILTEDDLNYSTKLTSEKLVYD